MTVVSDAADGRAAYQREVTDRAAATAARLWRQMDAGSDFSVMWRESLGRRLLATLVSAQTLAATGATDYVAAALAAQGAEADALGSLAPGTFAGYAADGRALDGGLYLPVVTVKQQIAGGLGADDALAAGLRQLLRFVQGEIGNAARLADGSALALDRTVTGYVRQVRLPSCGKCLILAGKFYRRNAGFARHPRCDCVHVPAATRDGVSAESPEQLLARMSPQEREVSLGKAGAAAVDAGGDVYQVVNASRGMRVAGAAYTTEGTTKRGYARQTTGSSTRLSPAGVLELHGQDAEQYAAALRANGYFLS